MDPLHKGEHKAAKEATKGKQTLNHFGVQKILQAHAQEFTPHDIDAAAVMIMKKKGLQLDLSQLEVGDELLELRKKIDEDAAKDHPRGADFLIASDLLNVREKELSKRQEIGNRTSQMGK